VQSLLAMIPPLEADVQAQIDCGESVCRNPMTGACCARAASGHAAAEQRDKLAPF